MTLTVMSLENMSSKSPPKYSHVQDTLTGALLLTEVGVDLRGCYVSGNKCINQLKSIVSGTEKAIKTLQITSKCTLEQAYKMVSTINSSKPTEECEELIAIIEKQLKELELIVGHKEIVDVDPHQKSDKVRMLEKKQKSCDNIAWPVSNKNSKSDINEKYPGSMSRESLIDLNTVVNLPPVPEDIFTSFSTKPTRSSSLSSLKSMRKVKMSLQKAESSDEDDSSDVEEHDFLKISIPKTPIDHKKEDGDELKLPSPLSKKILGNIKEETKFDE